MTARRAAPVAEKHFTTEQVAELLGVSVGHVRNLACDGELPFLDVSRKGHVTRRPKLRFPESAVAAFIHSRTQQRKTS